MRPIWSGSLSFGLVNIPIKLYSATAGKELDLDILHKKDMSPIRYARVCREDGKEVPYEEVVKGYEYRKGDYIVLTDDDFEKVNLKKTKSIEVIEFVDEKEVDVIYPEKPYYLEPDRGADKAYIVLREALKKSGKVGVGRYVLRDREHLGIIKPMGNFLIFDQIRYAQEIESPSQLSVPNAIKLQKDELDMALNIIDQMTKPFKPESFHDTYRNELDDMLKQKAKGIKPRMKGKEMEATKAKDLMEALKQSLEKARKERPSINA